MSVLTKLEVSAIRASDDMVCYEYLCDSHEALRARVETLEAALRRLRSGEGGAGLRLSAHMESIIEGALSGEPKGGGA